MKDPIFIRPEALEDIPTIEAITIEAFANLEISEHNEQFVIAALRAAGALTLSLVAVRNGQIVGHIAFSPVSIEDGTLGWYGLGPVSVRPAYQRQGIGAALIRDGLAWLKEMGATGCCLVGHPDYYPRFGFRQIPDLVIPGIPPEVFLALPFTTHIPQGKVTFHEAFRATGSLAES